LLYPVADCNLEDYLHDIYANAKPILLDEWWDDYYTMQSFYHCLSSALQHIHMNLTKHMDIKPQNILIIKSSKRTRPMIADFGIARSYQSLEDTETDGVTSFTKRYAAPEVVKQDSRGLFADIFSMGCVFLEIFAATQANYRGDLHGTLQNIRKNNVLGDTSYQANLTDIQNALSDFWVQHHSDDLAADNHVLVIRSMFEERSLHRPTAEELVSHFPERPSCGRGTPKFKANPTGK
jgi:serine/threonine protein kinase